MHSQSRYDAGRTGRPRSRGRVTGDKGEHRHQSQFDNPAECRVREPGGNGNGLGDEGKAAGCVPPAALLSLHVGLCISAGRSANSGAAFKDASS